MLLLVGDNPFHGISHLSQERVRTRGERVTNPEYAAKLVMISLENGADGFMFSVSESTLSILLVIHEKWGARCLRLYALTPYAYEYVRSATQVGMLGLTRRLAKRILTSGNVRAIAAALKGIARTDLADLIRSFMLYEISRVKSAIGEQGRLESLLLHELVTDMCLALNLDWLVDLYIDFTSSIGIKPGFETRNFVHLVGKFKEWGIDLREIVIAAPFNRVGFQMSPSRVQCEQALASLSVPNVIAISILAAGYLKLPEAAEYIKNLPNLKGIAIGVSKAHYAYETFKFFKEYYTKFNYK